MKCPKCGSKNIGCDPRFDKFFVCKDCNNMWWEASENNPTASGTVDYIMLNIIYGYKNEIYDKALEELHNGV